MKVYNPDVNQSDLICYTLAKMRGGDKVARILAAGINAVDPHASVSRTLEVVAHCLEAGELSYDLNAIDKIILIGIGKAAVPMSRGVLEKLGDRVTSGLVITKDGYGQGGDSLMPVGVIEAGHPLPDQRAVRASQRVSEMLSETSQSDLVICAISGGGSALFTLPIPGVSLPELRAVTEALLKCGAAIDEINTVRKHLDQVKGGGLAARAYPASLVSLILSDVVGDKLDIIASGPTVPDPSTFLEAQKVLDKYQLGTAIPSAISISIKQGINGDNPETPKPGSRYFEQVQNVLVGTNEDAARSALKQAKAERFSTQLLTTLMQGEARFVGEELAHLLKKMLRTDPHPSRPFCLVSGGETTVTLRGDGKGGRNQELALASVEILRDIPNVALITLATDGGDGPTDAAGAMVTGDTFKRAMQLGLQPSLYLENNDSYSFFEKLGDNLKPGPTQTNVNDLVFLFAF